MFVVFLLSNRTEMFLVVKRILLVFVFRKLGGKSLDGGGGGGSGGGGSGGRFGFRSDEDGVARFA